MTSSSFAKRLEAGSMGCSSRRRRSLRGEVNGLTVKSASHEVDIQKGSDVSRLELVSRDRITTKHVLEAVKKMEKQRNLDGQNFKAQLNRRIEAFLIPEKSEDDVVARLTPPSFRYCTCKLL